MSPLCRKHGRWDEPDNVGFRISTIRSVTQPDPVETLWATYNGGQVRQAFHDLFGFKPRTGVCVDQQFLRGAFLTLPML